MRFVDEAKIVVAGGHGGNGCISFRREKYVPRGGPDGGDGGRGGNVVLKSTSRKQTLLDFTYKHIFKAKRGQHGRGKDQHGKNGEDLVIFVPVGTVVKDAKTGKILFDFTNEGQEWIAAHGGQGGKGNARFVSATRQAPRYAEEGKPGEERELILELKLLADAGLVGFPNAGKSTLITAISSATPKIADYPFTTLTPSLGVVKFKNAEPYVVADIPGIIEGAHEGKGLGIRFLKHIERTRVLVYVLDVTTISEGNARKAIEQVNAELKAYNPELLERPSLVVLNKIDLVNEKEKIEELKGKIENLGYEAFAISALKRLGLERFLKKLTLLVTQEKEKDLSQPEEELYSPV